MIVILQMGGGFGLINTGEDCLHLSVHVPLQQDGDEPMAVMVWTIVINHHNDHQNHCH